VEQLSSAQHFIEGDVDPAQPQPTSQARKHTVGGQAWGPQIHLRRR
jgi:hypothetical protein